MARTGGALVILGMIVLLVGLFLSDSVVLLFQVFPRPILGVILFFAGVELALRPPGDRRHGHVEHGNRLPGWIDSLLRPPTPLD